MELPTVKTKPIFDMNKYIFTIYGDPKTGKTTLASEFEDTLFIATEPGHKFVEAFVVQTKSWPEVQEAVRALLTDKDHKFKTVVFDVVDNAYNWCEDAYCNKSGIEHVSDAPFGKGYQAAQKEFKKVIDALANRGYGIVFISHRKTKEKTIKEGAIERSITYTATTLGNKASEVVTGLSDFILYTHRDSEGNHLMRTKSNENFLGGDRSGKLPEVMETSYQSIVKYLKGRDKV